MDTIRVGFIGAGNICRDRHLPGLAKINDVKVVAVCNQSRQSAAKIADEFDIPEVEQDWSRLVARDDLDAIFVCTWPNMHKQFSIAVLDAGKHCFCQARMAMDLRDAKQMFATAQAHPNLVNMICPCPWPCEQYLRDVAHEGKLGQITSVELISVGATNLDRTTIHWRERVELSGHQAMAMGIFAETLNALVGPYELLTAHKSTPIATKTDESGLSQPIGVPQVITIAGQLENGALAVEHHSGLAVDTSSCMLQITIRGLDGTLRYDFDQTMEFAAPDMPLEPVQVPDNGKSPWTVEEDFICAVRAAQVGQPPEDRSVRPDFAEGLLYMRKVQAVHLAADRRQAVRPSQL